MTKRKRIAVLGAGFVTKPAVDYFLDKCGYEVIVTSLDKSEAEKIIDGRPGGRAVLWSKDQLELLDSIVEESDLVLSMVPPQVHIPVAEACLKYQKNMVTTSYVSQDMEALDESAKSRGILILNEIGEDPGLDNMRTKQMIDEINATGGTVTSISSYGAGLPSFEDNNNPLGYKFSWSPAGVIAAAKSSAAYIVDEEKISVLAKDIFREPRPVELADIGQFEAYPNRDSSNYLECFGLDNKVSIYRGILRYKGWCELMRSLAALQLLDTSYETDFSDRTYAAFTHHLTGNDASVDVRQQTAIYLNEDSTSEIIEKLEWLGLFSTEKIAIPKGTNADLLIDLMIRRMSYTENERDMVIVHASIDAEFSGRLETRSSTLLVNGIPGGDSAMSRAVSLPAAIASRLILEGKITVTGVQRPTSQQIYQPVLKEMESFGYVFVDDKSIVHF